MKRFVAALLLLMVNSALAQLEHKLSVTADVATTQVEEAKPYLAQEAILEVLRKYSQELAIDPTQFRSRLEEKFQQHFERFKEKRLTERFGKNFAEELSADQKQSFLAALEKYRAAEFLQFARLESLADSVEFSDVTLEASSGQRWKGLVQVNLNRSRVDGYYKRILSAEAKQYPKILVIVDINPIGFDWPELGLKSAHQFSHPLLSSWLKWLSNNQPQNSGELTGCENDCREMFNSWLQIPQEQGIKIPLEAQDSLWIRISLNIHKLFFRADINEWKFEWDGSVVVVDANTKLVLFSNYLLPESRRWRGMDQKSLNSALASSLYRSPLDAFTKLTRKVEKSQRLTRLSRLAITGNRNLGDVLSLMDLLKNEGKELHLELQLDLLNHKEAQLLCFYQGEEKSFIDLLSRVKELKSTHRYSVVNEFNGLLHILKLVSE